MKNQPGDRKIFNIFRLCFLMLLAVSAIGAAVYTVTNPQIETWGSDVIYLDGLQARDKDGNPIEITANQRYEYDENDILEVSHMGYHRRNLGVRNLTAAEVRSQPVPKLLGFPDINNRSRSILHQVYSGTLRYCIQSCVKRHYATGLLR